MTTDTRCSPAIPVGFRERTADPAAAPPLRPSPRYELHAGRLFRALSPRLRERRRADRRTGSRRPADRRSPRPPRRLAPFTRFEIDRRPPNRGRLAATWYPADGDPAQPRGAVLLAHPWVRWGQAYFHRHGRLEALRAAGYHAMTFDFGGVGSSGPPPRSLYDADLEDALAALRERAPDLPVHFWGVSFGGYWAHPLLSRTAGVAGAVFEDVAPHLIEWSKRLAPLGYPAYLVFQHLLRPAYRYLDLYCHAPHLLVRAATYVGGGLDRGVLPAETRRLARLAGGGHLVIPGADHLQANKIAGPRVIAAALATFAS